MVCLKNSSNEGFLKGRLMESGELLDSKAALTGVSTLVPCWSPEWIWWSLYDAEGKKEPPDQMRSQPGASWASVNPPMLCSFVPEECNNKLQHISGLSRVWLPPLRAFVLLLIFQFRGCDSNHISLPEHLSIMSDAAILVYHIYLPNTFRTLSAFPVIMV